MAEPGEFSVRYIKSVVTDDRGRFVVPDFPPATYTVWARGYGLVDSDKATAKPGQRLAIAAKVAPNDAAAAHYYPAIYCTRCSRSPRPINSAARAVSLSGCHRTSGLQP